MRVDVSLIFALVLSPFVVDSNEQHFAASMVREALLDVPDMVFAMHPESALIGTIDPDYMEESWLHRELQSAEECNATYNELWQDEALNEAFTVYSQASDAALDSIATADFSTACTQGATGGLSCDFNQPIDGETEFTSACTTAGGEVLPYTLDLSCDATLGAGTTTIVIDLPTQLHCIPASADFASCADAFRGGIQNLTDIFAVVVETSFTAAGFSDVACTVVDAGGSGAGGGDTGTGGGDTGAGGGNNTGTGGGSNTGGNNTGTGGGNNTGTEGGGGSSQASALGILFAFGLMTIVSLTLG